MVLFFSVRGEEKYEINYKKKKKFFSLLSGAFSLFFFVSLLANMIRKCFGGKGEGVETKKIVNLRKRC